MDIDIAVKSCKISLPSRSAGMTGLDLS